MIKTIAILSAVAALAVLWGLGRIDSPPLTDCVGTAEIWSVFRPFHNHAQAEVLASGLDDVRGLAVDAQGDVLLAEANGRILEYNTCGELEEVNLSEVKPETSDQRGTAFAGEKLVIAEHGRARIVERQDPKDPLHERVVDTGGKITAPSGVATVPGSNILFVTDDRPWHDAGSGPVSVCALADYQCKLAPVTSQLRHPSGIATAGPDGPVYVAESDGKQVRWPFFEKQNERWIQTGSLGAASADGATLPPFLGVAVGVQGRYIFAAGPKGLYIFTKDRGMLGRMDFEKPVTGVACGTDAVYLVTGHRLCRIAVGQTMARSACAEAAQ